MKKLYFLMILLASAVIGNAQNFVFSTTMHVDKVIKSNDLESHYIKFKTPNPEAITYKWTLIENSLISGWDYSLCDHGSCYVSIPNEGTMVELTKEEADQGTEVFFSLTISPMDIEGSGSITLFVYDAKDPMRGDTVSFKMTYKAPSSVASLSMSGLFRMFPNPASDWIQFQSITGSQINDIQIYNNVGEVVINETSSTTKAISVASLTPGMYIIRLHTTDGQILSERLVIQ